MVSRNAFPLGSFESLYEIDREVYNLKNDQPLRQVTNGTQ
jgi:hypothetical protein